jgi:hypothetical protein
MTENADDRVAELERELAKVKAAIKPYDSAAMQRVMARLSDENHQAAEARMSRASAFSRADLAAMDAACPADTIRDLVSHSTIPGPSTAGGGGQVSKVSSNPGIPGSNTGWRDATPLGPPPGINHVDRLLDHADAQDRAERIAQEAQRQAMLKVAGTPK